MRRGEIWTVSGGGYTGKPRPAVIVQDDRFSDSASITVCPLTTDPTEALLFRLVIDPNPDNGLRETSRLMIDKVTTLSRTRVGQRLGRLEPLDIARMDRAIMVFLGLSGDPARRRLPQRRTS